METFQSLINGANDLLWTYVLIALLIGCGLWFSLRTRFVQFRLFREMIRTLGESAPSTDGHERHISSFQAFTISLASRVGTGNLAGVATAITVGGPGAIFWMWVIALIGASSSFVESTLAQLFKVRGETSFIGGPAYYMEKGLKKRWMGVLFAVLITLTFGFAFNSVQSNTLCAAFEHAFGTDPLWMGLGLTTATLLIILGGVHRIARVSSLIVPVMAVGYLLLALLIVVMNLEHLPAVLTQIVENAFGLHQAVGGTLSAALMQGIRRGLFSNEAGMGSAPNAAATAHVGHPVQQGFIQTLGVFSDTLLICSCTAFIILCSGVDTTTTADGVQLTQTALTSQVGSIGASYVAVALMFFAYSSILGNYYYGEANLQFITRKKWVLQTYRLLAGSMVLFGAVASLNVVWSLADLFMALMALCNLTAILLLGKYAFRLLDDYCRQKRAGVKNPVFRKEQMKDIAPDITCW